MTVLNNASYFDDICLFKNKLYYRFSFRQAQLKQYHYQFKQDPNLDTQNLNKLKNFKQYLTPKYPKPFITK